jgi:hypothetical protein
MFYNILTKHLQSFTQNLTETRCSILKSIADKTKHGVKKKRSCKINACSQRTNAIACTLVSPLISFHRGSCNNSVGTFRCQLVPPSGTLRRRTFQTFWICCLIYSSTLEGRQYVSLGRQYISDTLHGVISQKIILYTATPLERAVGPSFCGYISEISSENYMWHANIQRYSLLYPVGWCYLHAVCVSVCFHLSNSEDLDQYLWSLEFASWNLNSSQWRSSKISPISLCLHVYPQGSVLVPLLYLLYAADLPTSPGSTTATFGDDMQ